MKSVYKKVLIFWVLIALVTACRLVVASVASELGSDSYKTTKESAEKGDSGAMYQLAEIYRHGDEGVGQDIEEALKWYFQAAEAGDPDASHEIGMMYEYGEGIHQDKLEAEKWFKQAVLQGSDRFFMLGMVYKAEGRLYDIDRAIRYFKRAADYGDINAHFELAEIYGDGDGVPEDDVEATKWIRHAAEKGASVAQLFLAIRYATGEGVPEDAVQAYAWSNLSAAQGESMAKALKSEIEKQMTSSQIEKAQELSSILFDKIHE